MKQELTRELLEDLYVTKKLSFKKIKEITGRGINAIRRKIEEYELEKDLSLQDRIEQKGEIICSREELENLYLIQNLSIRTIATKLGCSKNKIANLISLYKLEKDYKTWVAGRAEQYRKNFKAKWGVEYPTQLARVQEKMIQTCLRKYGTPVSSQCEAVKAKQRATNSTGIPNAKRIETKRQNHSWNTSKPEEQAYEMLVAKYGKEDIIRQYQSSQYPYPCDFYIKSMDTYIEFQGSWIHGHCPFNPDDLTHKKIVEKWRSKGTDYFSYAVEIWSVRDPAKRGIAKQNNLNWLEFFSIKELEKFTQS